MEGQNQCGFEGVDGGDGVELLHFHDGVDGLDFFIGFADRILLFLLFNHALNGLADFSWVFLF